MKFLILFTFIFSFKAFSCTPSKTNCEFYNCMEDRYQCGTKGFYKLMGYEYCTNFQTLDKNRNFSAYGKVWVRNTRICLQKDLLKLSHLSCDKLSKASVDSHIKCYVDNGYCNLSLLDKLKIIKLLGTEFIQTPAYILQNFVKMIGKCP